MRIRRRALTPTTQHARAREFAKAAKAKAAYRVQVEEAGVWYDAAPVTDRWPAVVAVLGTIHPLRPARVLKGLGGGAWRVLTRDEVARIEGL